GGKGDPGFPGLPGPAGYRGQKGDRVNLVDRLMGQTAVMENGDHVVFLESMAFPGLLGPLAGMATVSLRSASLPWWHRSASKRTLRRRAPAKCERGQKLNSKCQQNKRSF
ncbi:hypothetical protein GOODEAATRI_008674, partial [Goodea atripinnis]